MNLRRSPSGAPYPFNPLHLSQTIGFLHADFVQRVGTDVTAAFDLAGGGLFSLNPASTSAPQAVSVSGRQWLQFGGNGVDINVGSWLQKSIPELGASWQYLSSQADFYFAASYRAPLLGGQQILAAASNPAVSNTWVGLITNLSGPGFRARWFGQNGGPVVPNLADTNPPDDALHVTEVIAETRKPPVDNPGVYQRMLVDSEQVAAHEPAATISGYAAMSTMTIGAVERSGSFDNSFGGRLRAAVWCYPCPPATDRQQLRAWLAEDAGQWPA